MRISDWSSDVGSSDFKKVNWSDMMGLDLGEVAENRRIILTGRPAMVPVDGDAAVALLEHGAGEGLDFGKADGRPAERVPGDGRGLDRSEEHTSELQSLMRISYAVFCLNKKKKS